MTEFALLDEGLELKTLALQTLLDWATLYGVNSASLSGSFEACLAGLCDPEESVQTVSAEGFSRLLLHRIVTGELAEQVLEGLLHLYFHPGTTGSLRLRQCLSYFWPTFAFSVVENREALMRVLPGFLTCWIQNRATEKDSDEDGSVSLSSVCHQLFYWCNPANAPSQTLKSSDADFGNPFAKLGQELLWAALKRPTTRAHDYLLLNSVIPKLPIDAGCPRLDLRCLFVILNHLIRQRQAAAAASESSSNSAALKRFIARLVELGASEEDQDEADERKAINQVKTTLKRDFSIPVAPNSASAAKKPVSAGRGRGRPRRNAPTRSGAAPEDILEDLDFLSSSSEDFAGTVASD